ncbi:bacterioferritin [Arhodomonas sp. SL1]|uniref:bacterioferritin n=1 Tax=Arhodomonas sp. SL1 TaxID=3425691 RepID=UPI003F8829C1
MQGDTKVLEYLNRALTNELTAINQYFLHARILQDWGLDRLGEKEYQESIDEMRHADNLIKRILFLEGLPNLQDLGRLMIGESVREILQCDLRAEKDGRDLYLEAIAYCESVRDYVSRDLLRGILDDEEGHIDWLETQLELIERVGEQNYQQSQISAGE